MKHLHSKLVTTAKGMGREARGGERFKRMGKRQFHVSNCAVLDENGTTVQQNISPDARFWGAEEPCPIPGIVEGPGEAVEQHVLARVQGQEFFQQRLREIQKQKQEGGGKQNNKI